MAIALVQQGSGENDGGLVSCTFSSLPTAGNLLVAVHMVTTRPLPNVTSLGVTNPSGFTTAVTSTYEDVDPGEEGRGCWLRIAYKISVGSETDLSFGQAEVGCANRTWAAEYSGLETVSVLDQTASSSAQGTITSCPVGTTGTTSQAEELLIAAGIIQITGGATLGSWDGSFVDRYEDVDFPFSYNVMAFTGDRVVAGTGTYGPTYTPLVGTGAYRAGAIATFKGNGGAAPTRTDKLTFGVVLP